MKVHPVIDRFWKSCNSCVALPFAWGNQLVVWGFEAQGKWETPPTNPNHLEGSRGVADYAGVGCPVWINHLSRSNGATSNGSGLEVPSWIWFGPSGRSLGKP